MFGGVPIMVASPPRRELKARGISSLDGATRVRRLMSMTTGSKSAATPTLFMKADRLPAVSMMAATRPISLPPASRIT